MQTLTAQQLKQRLDRNEKLLLINVLDEDEFERQLPGSRNVPVNRENFVQRVRKAGGSENKEIVVYCASTDCGASPKAAKELDEAGFTHVYDFEGGIKAWREAGYELVRPQTATVTA